MGWTRGLEPPTTGITSRGSTIELRPPYCVQVARLAGLEPATYSLEGCCSILLSYRRSPDRVIRLKSSERMVGAERFELPTLWSQTRCATRLRYAPNYILLLERGGQYASACRSSIPESPLTHFFFNVRMSIHGKSSWKC